MNEMRNNCKQSGLQSVDGNLVTKTGSEGRVFSGDLRRMLGEQGLLRLSLDAVQALDLPWTPRRGGKGAEFRPQMLMTLLTYCYLSTFYGSRDIELAIRHDPTVRYICARAMPDWLTLRRFRREFRAALHQCLVWVLKQTWALRFDEGEADYVGYEWFESQMVEQMNEEASERL